MILSQEHRPHRVAITGIGAMCALGNNIETIWTKALDGVSAITPITDNPDIMDELKVKIAGQVPAFDMPEELMSAKEYERYDRFISLAMYGSYQALKMANLDLLTKENPYDPFRSGVILGVGMGGFNFTQREYTKALEKGPRRISPFYIWTKNLCTWDSTSMT